MVNYVDVPLQVMLECMHTKYCVNTKRIAARITLKKHKEVDDMSPRSKDASVNRFLTRLGTFLNNDVALTPMECLQRIYILYDEEVNA